MMEAMVPFLKGVLAGAVYGATHYIKKMKEQDFEPVKFARTAIVGGVIGAVAGAFGVPFEGAENAIAELGLYGGLTAIAENVVMFLKRAFE